MLKNLLRAGAIALALLTSTAAGAPPTITATFISDTVKFPKEDVAVLKAIGTVNHFVNEKMVYVSDLEHYGVEEKWVSMPEDSKGDCEDYALTKMELLRQMGVPIVAVAKIRSVTVRDAKGKFLGNHAILELLLPKGSVAFLDLRFDDLMTRRELEAKGYVFYDWG